MMCIISIQVFWYPIACTFIFGKRWPLSLLLFEIISLLVFSLDIIINMRTTYSNENNEEIIDTQMIRDNYIKSPHFVLDFITTLPLPELILMTLIGSPRQWEVYSLIIMVRMLRFLKAMVYLENMTLGFTLKLLRIFVTLFIVVSNQNYFVQLLISLQGALGFMCVVCDNLRPIQS